MEKITDREMDIIRYLCKGYTDEEIASALFISLATVKSHIYHLLRKLDLKNRTQLVIYAFEKKMFTDENQPKDG